MIIALLIDVIFLIGSCLFVYNAIFWLSNLILDRKEIKLRIKTLNEAIDYYRDARKTL